MRYLLGATLVALGLAGAAPLHARLQALDAPVLRLTAVVTDAKGRPLAGLKPADFDLVVDGAPHAVEAVQVAREADTPRAFAIVLDEFHLAEADSPSIRSEVLRFLDTHLRPADMALVFKPLDSLDSISMQAERDVLRQAISTFEGRKGNYAARTDFERRYMAQAPAAVAAARAQIVTSALRAIATNLSQRSDVTPVILLVSDGFGRTRTSRDVPANLQAAIRIANRAGTPIYAFAPGLERPSPSEDRPDPAFAALQTVTADTGGNLTTGIAALGRGLSTLIRELDARYILTYRPAHGSDGRFHEVRLATRRPGAQVRTQAGYIAEPVAAARPGAAASSAPLRVLRRSALIQSWSGFFPSTADRGTVMVTWEPTPPRPSRPTRASTIVLTASTADGEVLFDAAVAPVGTRPSAGLPNAATFDAPRGPVRVDIKVLDASGVVIDTDARDLTTPAARADRPTIYPPALFRTRSAREFREALENMQAAPVATRDFRRTDRLLVRVPAVDASGAPVPVTAVLLNRWRHPMRNVPPIDAAGPPNTTQFDLPLAPLAPGEYGLRLTVSGPAGNVTEVVSFRVQG
jgi:VWFA-related protein